MLYRISFLFQAEYYSTVCIDHILFLHSPIDDYLGHFHLSAVVNNAAMNWGTQHPFKSRACVYMLPEELLPPPP